MTTQKNFNNYFVSVGIVEILYAIHNTIRCTVCCQHRSIRGNINCNLRFSCAYGNWKSVVVLPLGKWIFIGQRQLILFS